MQKISFIAPYSDDQGNTINGRPLQQSAVDVVFKAKNCSLTVADSAKLNSVNVTFEADGSSVFIGEDTQFVGMLLLGLGSKITIGRSLTVTRYCFISAAERTSVDIGGDCMFASAVELRCDDAHPIFDMDTGERINPSRSIAVGNHVWIASNVILLGGAEIGSGSVIGNGSLVTGKIPENCLAVGKPARVVRERVVWDRSHVAKTRPHAFDNLRSLKNPYSPG